MNAEAGLADKVAQHKKSLQKKQNRQYNEIAMQLGAEMGRIPTNVQSQEASRPRIHEVVEGIPRHRDKLISPPIKDNQKTTIMTKRQGLDGQKKQTNYHEYTFVQNSYATEEIIHTAAKASSIGSTENARSQGSSDSVPKGL